MSIPGFAAEFSLYKTSDHHRMVMTTKQAIAGQVIPQFSCGACTCDRGECCYYSPYPGGYCACLPRDKNGACPQIGRGGAF